MISAISILLTLVVMIGLNSLYPRTMDAYRIVVVVSAVSAFIFLIIATQVTVYHHRFDTHPTSFIAQTKVAGKGNMKAFWYYLATKEEPDVITDLIIPEQSGSAAH